MFPETYYVVLWKHYKRSLYIVLRLSVQQHSGLYPSSYTHIPFIITLIYSAPSPSHDWHTHTPNPSLTTHHKISSRSGMVRVCDKQNRNRNAKKVYQKTPFVNWPIPCHIPNLLFLWRGGSDSKPLYVESVMNKEALELGFSPSTSVLPCPYLSKAHSYFKRLLPMFYNLSNWQRR
jgi:hypothetical protein